MAEGMSVGTVLTTAGLLIALWVVALIALHTATKRASKFTNVLLAIAIAIGTSAVLWPFISFRIVL
jgi:hypothetical protein